KCLGCGFTPRTVQNAPQAENATPEQNPVSTLEGDLISFDKNPPTHHPREARELAVDPEIRFTTNEQEKAWIDLVSTGTLIFAEKYKGEAIQYDVNSMYIYEMLKKEASWPVALATIEGNPPKKSLQCTRYLQYNPHGIYTHYDLESAKRNGLKVYLINESPNALIYERNVCITGKNMFEEWGNILYNIKKEGGIAGKVSKALLVSLWGVLCEQRNGQNYGTHPRIKSFLLASTRKTIFEIVKPLGDQVKRIHTDGFIVVGRVNLKTGKEIALLRYRDKLELINTQEALQNSQIWNSNVIISENESDENSQDSNISEEMSTIV
ncbi:18651_t:CDS:2, partial [Acaulospora morrowiae]